MYLEDFDRSWFLNVQLIDLERRSRQSSRFSSAGNIGMVGGGVQTAMGPRLSQTSTIHALPQSSRTGRVRNALTDSEHAARHQILTKLPHLKFDSVAHLLMEGCVDLALIVGSASIPGSSYGLAGSPGNSLRLVTSFWGFPLLTPYLEGRISIDLSPYRNGFAKAWGSRLSDMPGNDRLLEMSAAAEFARGHIIVIQALLKGIVAILSDNGVTGSPVFSPDAKTDQWTGGRAKALLAQIRDSKRLGNAMATWLGQHGEVLLNTQDLRMPARHAPSVEAASMIPLRGRTQATSTESKLYPDVISDREPSRPAKPLHWIEIELVGENDCAIPWEEYELHMPDGSKRNGMLDENGIARVENIENPGSCSISFPKLDRRAWDWKAARSVGKSDASAAKPGPDRDWKPRMAGTRMVNTHVQIEKAQNVHSLAFDTGHMWSTIWNHPDNSAVCKQRLHPEVLSAGDILFVPPIDRREEAGTTDKRHQFRRLGVPSIFRFRPLFLGDPFANQPYRVTVDSVDTASGTTADTGLVECYVRPDAAEATVVIGSGYFEFTYRVGLRGISPFDTSDGIEQRLHQLGYFEGGQSASEAITAFQDHHGLQRSGSADPATLATLLREFGR